MCRERRRRFRYLNKDKKVVRSRNIKIGPRLRSDDDCLEPMEDWIDREVQKACLRDGELQHYINELKHRIRDFEINKKLRKGNLDKSISRKKVMLNYDKAKSRVYRAKKACERVRARIRSSVEEEFKNMPSNVMRAKVVRAPRKTKKSPDLKGKGLNLLRLLRRKEARDGKS